MSASAVVDNASPTAGAGEPGHGNDSKADGSTAFPLGGGIYNQDGDLYVFSSSVGSNRGSGIYNAGDVTRLYDTQVENNSRTGILSFADTGRAVLQVEESSIGENGLDGTKRKTPS